MTTAPPTEAPPDAGPATSARPELDPQPVAPAKATKERPPPMGAGTHLVRTILVVVFVLTAAMTLHAVFLSSLQQRSAQQELLDRYRLELANQTAPTGPLSADGEILPVGTPIAYLEIPDIGVKQVVVSGTTSRAMFDGPGHRRDTVMPGQAGVSVIMGRSAMFGGPFGDIGSLDKGDRITVTTGTGTFTYKVLAVRHEGDAVPPAAKNDESRIVLTSADGAPFLPSGVVRVDAAMDGKAEAGPGRLFKAEELPMVERTMAGDTSQLWALAFWLEALILVAVGAVWAWHRWGHPQAWIAFLPPLLLVGLAVANQAARLLPNMM